MRRNRLHLQWLACQRRGRAPCPPQLWNPCHFSFWASRAIPAGTHAGASVSLGRRLVLRLFFSIRAADETSGLVLSEHAFGSVDRRACSELLLGASILELAADEIGRASRRERVCQYG